MEPLALVLTFSIDTELLNNALWIASPVARLFGRAAGPAGAGAQGVGDKG
jgi:hypothetical protein